MKFLRFVFVVGIITLAKLSYSQGIDNVLSSNSFKSGEQVTYRAVYNWGFIWINAGDVVFTVKDTLYNGKDCFHFISKGWSLKQYDWFYKVRDRFESIASKDSLKPYWFLRNTYEGGYIAYNEYNFDYSGSKLNIYSYTSDRTAKKEASTLKPFTFDVLTAIYFCRNLNFDKLLASQKVPLRMAIDNEVFDLYVRYLGKEDITLHDGRLFKTHKFSVMLVKGSIFKGGEDLFVWVTDDSKHIPVLVEAKILVGSVKAVLVNF